MLLGDCKETYPFFLSTFNPFSINLYGLHSSGTLEQYFPLPRHRASIHTNGATIICNVTPFSGGIHSKRERFLMIGSPFHGHFTLTAGIRGKLDKAICSFQMGRELLKTKFHKFTKGISYKHTENKKKMCKI
jgi:hypothetical protein